MARRAAILDASSRLIAEFGFDDTSLEAICDAASCSKTAIYELFGNKQGILSALSEEIAEGLAQALHTFHLEHLSVDVALRRYAQMVLEKVLNDRYIGIIRAIVSVSWRYPEIGPTYYQVGAGAARRALATYLQQRHAAGELDVTDPERAADEFQGMLLWDQMLAQLVGASQQPQKDQLELQAQSAVELFLHRHAPRPDVTPIRS